jgi:dTDP-4-dehydrorhamnose 3,5-epimerase
MEIVQTEFAGLVLLKPKSFEDGRGYFFELWSDRLSRQMGYDVRFVQDNISFSRKGVLRGLHFQNPHPQGKLVTVLQGEVLDVVVDLRKKSSTFGKWRAVVLSGENKLQMFVPPGFAHGFLVRSEAALFHYKCTEFYYPEDEVCLRWDDPEIGIDWGSAKASLSGKDAKGLSLREIPSGRLFSQ